MDDFFCIPSSFAEDSPIFFQTQEKQPSGWFVCRRNNTQPCGFISALQQFTPDAINSCCWGDTKQRCGRHSWLLPSSEHTHTHSHFSDGEVQILEVGSSTVSSCWCLLASWIDWLIDWFNYFFPSCSSEMPVITRLIDQILIFSSTSSERFWLSDFLLLFVNVFVVVQAKFELNRTQYRDSALIEPRCVG